MDLTKGELSVSPVPKKKTVGGFDFPEAMKQIIAGKKVTRLDWGGNGDYCLFKDNWLMIFTKGQFHRWLVNDGDLMGQDWITLPEDKSQVN
jgi:hypothetical protein